MRAAMGAIDGSRVLHRDAHASGETLKLALLAWTGGLCGESRSQRHVLENVAMPSSSSKVVTLGSA